ncbi:hypothetical protein B9Z19DRAFT_1071414 [Tuber borchii]|uniref:Uncharacterized protein n=1 Tax=Tuber borchii TaxID=42251 RepID=A0A2T7A807_TUBBO|nr:hypothetical protein B9Z19DRAFT_1071414 [Tuber borchii]
MSPLHPMNSSEVYQPPASPPDASPFGSSSPQPPPQLLVTYTDHKSNTASIVIAALSLIAIFLALAFLVVYGVYRFGIGFLQGKRVPRKGGEVICGNGALSLLMFCLPLVVVLVR